MWITTDSLELMRRGDAAKQQQASASPRFADEQFIRDVMAHIGEGEGNALWDAGKLVGLLAALRAMGYTFGDAVAELVRIHPPIAHCAAVPEAWRADFRAAK